MSSHYRPGSSTQEVLGALRARKTGSRREQDAEYRAQLVAALKQQRQQLIDKGAMPTSLPHIHDAMGPRDIAAAQTAMDGGAVARFQREQKNGKAGQYTKAPEVKPVPAAPAVRIPAAQVADTRNAIKVDRKAALDDIAKRKAAGEITADQARAELNTTNAALAGVAKGNTSVPTRPTLNNPTPAPLAEPGSPEAMAAGVKSLPFSNGTRLPADAVVNSGPGGSTVMQEGLIGSVPVSFQPTLEQVMDGKSGGKWSKMTPAERAAFIPTTATPFSGGGGGRVVDTGKTAPTFDGTSTHQTPAGPVNVYDPRDDQGIITAPTAPGADRSVYVPEKYGGGVGSVTYGTGTPPAPGFMPPPRPAATALPAAPSPVAAPPVPEAATVPPPQASNPGQPPRPRPAPFTQPEAATAMPPQASATSTGSEGMGPDVVDDFAQNEYDKQFQKNLRFSGFSRGALT